MKMRQLLLLPLLATAILGEVCDRSDRGTSFDLAEDAACDFIILDPSFRNFLNGTSQSIEVILENAEQIFHEGPVLFDNELYFTTNRLGNTSLGPTWLTTAPAQLEQFVDIYRLDLTTKQLDIVEPTPPILMANGMTRDGDDILVLSQGFNLTGGGVYRLNRETLEATPVLTTFYGAAFNSFNDIEITGDGILFITDPPYGFEQGFRQGVPELGSNIYRYDLKTKKLKSILASLQRPNGVALFDERIAGRGCSLFVSDTGFEGTAQAPRGFNGHSDSQIFMLRDPDGCFEKTATFIYLPVVPVILGIQDGIQVHESSKLFLYCDGNGLWVWSITTLSPLGLVHHPCTQLVFAQKEGVTKIYILAETQLLSTELNFVAAPDEDEGSPPSSARLVPVFAAAFATAAAVLLLVFA